MHDSLMNEKTDGSKDANSAASSPAEGGGKNPRQCFVGKVRHKGAK